MWAEIKKEMKHLKTAVREIAHDQSGQRFIRYHERRKKKQQGHPVKKALVYIIGFVLIAAGFLLGFVPGAPGFFLGVPGMLIIASHSKVFALMLDKGERSVRALLKKT